MAGAVHHVTRVAVAILIAIGVLSAAARTYIMVSGDARALASMQRAIMRAYRADEARIAEWNREMAVIEARYAAHDLAMAMHAFTGGAFLLLAPLQFRRRRGTLHRRLGRVLVVSALASGIAGLFLGVLIPVGGAGEVTSTALFGALFVFALIRAWIAIRARQIEVHRRWMIRAFAIALGISMIRIVGSVIQTFWPMSVFAVVGWMFWIGWSATLLAGEWWIARVPPSSRA